MENQATQKPKYEQIMDDILSKIENNAFSYEHPICTEKQISEQYNVSRITAKRAITELEHKGILYRKRGVGSFVTRNAVSNLDNITAQPQTDSKMVSLLLPFDITRGGLYDTIEVINKTLNQNGYFMSLYISDISSKKEKDTLKLLLSQNISGLVYYPNRDKIYLNILNEFILKGIPVIVIDKSTDCPYVHNIVSDNFEGGRLLTEHLISLGHRNICFFTTAAIEDTSTIRNRFGGYLHQLRSSGIIPNPRNVVFIPSRVSDSDFTEIEHHPFLESIKHIYESGVTAIIAENDYVASFIMLCCKQLNLRVPEDISICGFDNTKISEDSSITTIKQDFHLIGEEVSKILLESLSSPSVSIQKVSTAVELIIRSSTGVPHK